jgi:neutral ceramidase
MRRIAVVVCLLLLLPAAVFAADGQFQVGFAKRDITPKAPMPMWGYGDRHNALSTGVLEPLMAKAIVIEAGGERLAIVGTDIGRGPTPAMMKQIREAVAAKAKVGTVLIAGSHSHHGPVIELTDEPGLGKGTYDDAVAYAKQLPVLLTEAIVEAASNLQPAKLGVAKANVKRNRNRHTKQPVRPTDPMLAVIRFDALDGKPIAVLVNFAAHPVTLPGDLLKFSPDYPGHLQARVEEELGTNCVFMQGASGDLSPDRGDLDTKGFGRALGDDAISLAKSIETEVPEKPSIKAKVDTFEFGSRVDFNNRLLVSTFQRAFFPELVNNFVREYGGGIRPEMTTVVLNGNLALVTGSGEFFCNHSNRLKERAYLPDTLFFGYCNGHHMYFPTIEAASEGGYGGDPTVAPVEVGAGEKMMNQALINIYTFIGRFPKNTIEPKPAK